MTDGTGSDSSKFSRVYSELRRVFSLRSDSIRLYRHDYWKKFGALQTFGAQCEDNNNMSVEGFVLIGLIPPALTPGVRWELLPEGAKERGVFRATREHL